MVTNDVDAIAVGSAAYALLLTPKARVVADMRLTRLGGDHVPGRRRPGRRGRAAHGADAVPAGLQGGDRGLRRAVRHRRRGGAAGHRAAGRRARRHAAGRCAGGHGHRRPRSTAGTVHVLRSAFCGEQAFELIGLRPVLDTAWERLVGGPRRRRRAGVRRRGLRRAAHRGGRAAVRRRDRRAGDAGRGRASSTAPSRSPRVATSGRSPSPGCTTAATRTAGCVRSCWTARRPPARRSRSTAARSGASRRPPSRRRSGGRWRWRSCGARSIPASGSAW